MAETHNEPPKDAEEVDEEEDDGDDDDDDEEDDEAGVAIGVEVWGQPCFGCRVRLGV